MGYKRILTVQDISCVGKCSMSIALPVLSACGHEVCILPTAVLSTHTGFPTKPSVCHMDDFLHGITEHWAGEGICFDMILTGYLGSVHSVERVIDICNRMLKPSGELIVDPAMADHGRMYSGLSESYAEAIKKLCAKADIIIPNITEAAILTDVPYQEPDEKYVSELLELLPCAGAVLTGVGYNRNETGAEIVYQGVRRGYRHPRFDKNYHGTGDLFAACFAGARACGKDITESVKIAADFTAMSIEKTWNDPAGCYGVKFEPLLWRLHDMLK